MTYGPNPDAIYPNEKNRDIVFIKNVVDHPNVHIGDYSFYVDNDHPERFQEHITGLNDDDRDQLFIGKFCSIGKGVKIFLNDADPRMGSTTAYPFHLMGHGWEKAAPDRDASCGSEFTVIGNDVWIGENVTILPGTHISDGAVIGADSTVSGFVPAYWVVAGDPVEFIRRRFDADTIESLRSIKWWDWPVKKIYDNLEDLCRI